MLRGNFQNTTLTLVRLQVANNFIGGFTSYFGGPNLEIGPSLINKSEGQVQRKNTAVITSARLRKILQCFLEANATFIEKERPALASKVCLATPQWMRHASIATVTPPIYLHRDGIKRAK